MLSQVLDLDGIEQQVRSATRRRHDEAGRTERRRGTLGSKEVFAGTRIPVAVVMEWLAAGRTQKEVLAAYPDLKRADVAVARRRLAEAA